MSKKRYDTNPVQALGYTRGTDILDSDFSLHTEKLSFKETINKYGDYLSEDNIKKLFTKELRNEFIKESHHINSEEDRKVIIKILSLLTPREQSKMQTYLENDPVNDPVKDTAPFITYTHALLNDLIYGNTY